MQDSASPAMPDWAYIQSLYTSGLKPKQISAQTGVKADTVSARASRYGWKALTLQVKQTVQAAMPESKAESSSELSTHSKAARSALGRLLARSAELVEQLPQTNGKNALKLHQQLESMVRNAKVIYPDWTEGETSSNIRIAVLNQLHVSSDPILKDKNSLSGQPTVEVEAQPLLPTPPS